MRWSSGWKACALGSSTVHERDVGQSLPAAGAGAGLRGARAGASRGLGLQVPRGVQAVGVRITARGGGGPVVAPATGMARSMCCPFHRRVLVTEPTLPVNSPGTHAFTLQKLLDSGKSTTLRHERLQLEFTPNPAWTAVQALPLPDGVPACLRRTGLPAGTTPTAWQATWWEKPRIRGSSNNGVRPGRTPSSVHWRRTRS